VIEIGGLPHECAGMSDINARGHEPRGRVLGAVAGELALPGAARLHQEAHERILRGVRAELGRCPLQAAADAANENRSWQAKAGRASVHKADKQKASTSPAPRP
jgi:hypothetical protein